MEWSNGTSGELLVLMMLRARSARNGVCGATVDAAWPSTGSICRAAKRPALLDTAPRPLWAWGGMSDHQILYVYTVNAANGSVNSRLIEDFVAAASHAAFENLLFFTIAVDG